MSRSSLSRLSEFITLYGNLCLISSIYNSSIPRSFLESEDRRIRTRIDLDLGNRIAYAQKPVSVFSLARDILSPDFKFRFSEQGNTLLEYIDRYAYPVKGDYSERRKKGAMWYRPFVTSQMANDFVVAVAVEAEACLELFVALEDEELDVGKVEIYELDGPVARKRGGSNQGWRKQEDRIASAPVEEERDSSLEVWIAGDVDGQERQFIMGGLCALLYEEGARWVGEEPPIFGSVYQKIKLRLLALIPEKDALAKVLRPVFFPDPDAKEQSEISVMLIEALAKHDNVVIKNDSFIAIKITREGETFVVCDKIPLSLQDELKNNPGLVKDHYKMYDAFMEHSTGKANINTLRSPQCTDRKGDSGRDAAPPP